MDGGGSAQMMLKGKIVNNPSDGSQRSVANGWMLFSTAPADNSISKIDFQDYKIKVPALASYFPSFLGYNKHGVLANENLSGVTLSCDPALGNIIDGKFVASATPQTGKLIATYNGIEIVKEITIENSGVGLSNPDLISKWKVYPNPVTNGIAYITVPDGNNHPIRLELCSLMGEKVLSQYQETNQAGEIRLSLDGLQAGVYLLNLYSENHKEVVKLILK